MRQHRGGNKTIVPVESEDRMKKGVTHIVDFEHIEMDGSNNFYFIYIYIYFGLLLFFFIYIYKLTTSSTSSETI